MGRTAYTVQKVFDNVEFLFALKHEYTYFGEFVIKNLFSYIVCTYTQGLMYVYFFLWSTVEFICL
jgi:hypothetical protein